jgi:hypothetical protein
MQINLSTLAILLGAVVFLVHICGVVSPSVYSGLLKKFPRSLPCGVVLMLLGTAWFLYYLNQESIADFAPYKPILLGGFAAVGLGSCIFVRDFLAVRGLAVVMMLVAKLMVDTARWADTDWRIVIVSWAYLLVTAGIWFTIYPWHFRDYLGWETSSTSRVRILSTLRVLFGVFIMALGFTVFKGA